MIGSLVDGLCEGHTGVVPGQPMRDLHGAAALLRVQVAELIDVAYDVSARAEREATLAAPAAAVAVVVEVDVETADVELVAEALLDGQAVQAQLARAAHRLERVLLHRHLQTQR